MADSKHSPRMGQASGGPSWRPLVTAVVPTFNASPFVGATLDALFAQTWGNLEIVIGDDCSTDGTYDVVRALAEQRENVVLIRQPKNLGWIGNTNSLMEAASGELIFMAFHDDVVAPTYVEKLVAALEANPRAVLAYSDLALVESDGSSTVETFSALDGRSSALDRGWVMSGGPSRWWVAIHGLFYATAFREVGGLRLNSAGEYSADLPWLFHLCLIGEFGRVPEVLCVKNKRPGSVSLSWQRGSEEEHALRQALADELSLSALPHYAKSILSMKLARHRPLPKTIRLGGKLIRKALRLWARLTARLHGGVAGP